MQEGPHKYLFVINPISGGREKGEFEPTIRAYFENLPHTIEFYNLTGKNDAQQLTAKLVKMQPHKVIAVGGDGTVSMVAKTLLSTGIQMGIIPAGSANGMARELNIPIALNDALKIVETGVIKKADVISINNQVCLHLSDIGLNARLIKYFEEGNTRGKLGYAKVAIKTLLRKTYMQLIIETQGKQLKRNAFMVVLANASKYGTGAVINPEGDLYDGLFEVVIIRKLPLSELFKMWFRPRPFNPENIEVIHAESVHIKTPKRVHFQVDGEYLGKVKSVSAEILPGQLHILLPPDPNDADDKDNK
ncbi:diacylglycerol/lipid kinase family protein [Aridibaculum aurantiacum]|uniref:diacylglycerol/lipid kinase family protein n=1 Tax=Aridibaculum aurantiacum TaxID=2810307 RepID=UPI001A962076|nr:YegS/Rv2252/BmrU family lipid kinase [Aridibaculum aurantiacum]